MAIPKRIKELTALALKDRVLTYKERKTIVQEISPRHTVFLFCSCVFGTFGTQRKGYFPVPVVFLPGGFDYQKYQRQTDTIYGESDEAKKLLADYAAEIEGYKKNRFKNRILLALVFAVVLSI